VRVDLEVLGGAGVSLLVWEVRAEGGEDAGPFLVGHLFAGVAAVGDLRDVVVRDAAEAFDQPLVVPSRES
jgi:hypothetical protein